jgi:hypothetical protein
MIVLELEVYLVVVELEKLLELRRREAVCIFLTIGFDVRHSSTAS